MPELQPLRVLYIEDSEDDVLLVTLALRRYGYDVQSRRVETASGMQAVLQSSRWDVVISDYSLPSFGAQAALVVLQESGLDIPFLVVSGAIIEEQAVAVLRAGAHDFVTKGNLARLAPAIERELHEAANRQARRQTQDRLAESQARFQQVWEVASDAMTLSDPDGNILAANPACFQLCGYTPEDIIGRNFALIFPEEQRALAVEAYKLVFASGVPRPSFEAAIRRADGTERVIEASWTLLNSDVQRTVMLSSSRDITERNQAAAALGGRDERLRVLANATPNGLIIVSETGEITWANQRSEMMFGYAPGQLLGMSIDALVPRRFQDGHSAHRGAFAADRRARSMGTGRDLFGLRRDGSEFPVEIGLSPIVMAEGKLTLASITDITGRKLSEAALRQSEERFAKAFRASSAAMSVTRLSDGYFVDVNQEFLDLFGYARDEVIGQTSSALGLFADPSERAEPVRRLQEAGTVRNFEMTLWSKSRLPRSVLFSTEPIELDGQAHALAILIDITDRKQAEEALHALNAELEARVVERTAELAANEAKLRALFEVLPVGVSIMDRERRVLQSNPALGRIMNTSLENLAAAAYARRTFIHPDGHPMLPAEHASIRALETQRPVLNVEMGLVAETGETIWLDVSAVPLPVADLGVVVVSTDITERKRAEAELQASNARFQFIVDANIIGVTRSDEHGQMLEANDYYLDLLGYSRSDFQAGLLNWRDRTPPEYLGVEAQAMAELKARGVCTPFEKESIRRDGSRAWVYLSNALLPDGTIAAFILDITERKRFEGALIEGRERNRVLFEAAQRQAQELALRDRLHQALARELPLVEILHLLVDGIAETLGYTLVSLYRLDGPVLKLEHHVGYDHVFGHIPVTEGVSGRVVRTGQPVLLADVRSDPAFLGAMEGITSEICVPLFEQGQVAGILNVESTQGVKLTDADLRLMLALADQVGFALDRARLAAQARESQQRFASAFSHASIGMALVAPDGSWLQVNPALSHLVGYSEPELLATTFQAITHPDDLETDLGYVRQMLAGTIQTYQMEKRYIHKLGQLVWALLSVSLVRDPAGQPLYFISQIEDITERKQAEQTLAHERDLMQALMDNIPDTIYFKDTASRFTRINRAQATVLGLGDAGAAIGKRDFDFFPPDLAESAFEEEQHIFQTGQPLVDRIEYNPTADGKPRWFSATKVPLRDASGQVIGMVGVSRNITAYKKLEDELRHQAAHDALTGLPNRFLLMDRLKQAFDHVQRHREQHFAALFLDLDRFKAINDTFGHAAGDQVLITTAKRIQSVLRLQDSVARLGGDEFVVLLDDIEDARGVLRVAERMQEAMAAPFDIGAQPIYTAASIGVALSAPGHQTPDDLLHDADVALYQAKSLGRGQISIFDRDLHQNALTMLGLENDLRRAVAREEFRVYYQPIISLATGAISGFEALLRWQHPERGLLQPDAFLPLAEEVSVLKTLGPWVLQQACRQAQAWQALAPAQPLTMSVNLSDSQIGQTGLVEQVAQALADSGLDPRRLCLEITEQVILDRAAAAPTLQGLAALGVQLHLDDFGIGYSSLSNLHHLPLDALKIDRSFLSQLQAGGRRESAIVRTIVLLARELDLAVIAEGIETAEHAAYLQSLGCEFGQGFWFSKPLEADAVPGLLGPA